MIESYRVKGLHHAREVNRAQTLSALDRGVSEAQMMEVLGVGRTAIWRARSAYSDGSVQYTLCDGAQKQPDIGSIRRETIRRLLKSCLKPWRKVMRYTCVITEEYRQRMYDLLD